jgi:RHS repeat-associated protein
MGIDHDPATGRVNGTVCANVTTSQDYDSSGALSYFETDYGGSSIFQTSYQRDSLNRISILTEVNQGQMTVKKYAYDIVGRLSQVWRNNTLVSTYSYDPNGNRIAKVTPASADSGRYDAQDRMLSYGNAQYIYSKNGELQKKIVGEDTTSYVYDYFGNLLKVTMPNGDVLEYMIDGQNRRIGKKINGAIVKKWIYAGGLSPIAELDSAYNVTAEFVGSLMIKNGNTYQLITDHLGSVRLVIDVNSGNIAQQIDYDEFGNVISDSNPDFQPFAYAGGLYDTQTKLVRFGARDYEPSSGRWQSKEALGFLGSNNFYVYAYNNPINVVDKNGLLVEVYYTPIISGNDVGTSMASAKGALHSFVHVQTPEYDLTFENLGQQGTNYGVLWADKFNPARTNDAIKATVNRPCPDNDYSFENSIVKEFYRLQDNPEKLPDYHPSSFTDIINWTMNNCNTFSAWLIHHAGGSINNVPEKAYGNSNFGASGGW